MSARPKYSIAGSTRGLILGLALSMAATGVFTVPAYASGGDPTWQPQASERLVKLPASYIKRSLEQDFTRSELGQALRDIDTEIGFKSETLTDLQAAIEASEGEVHTDLRHQFLVEKREYIELVSRKIELRRKAMEKKSGVLEKLMKRMGQQDAELTPIRRELIERQSAARARFETSISGVDMELLETSVAPESKYSRQFASNLSAIDSLSRAIEQHPMSRGPEVDGVPVTREDYVRQMIADAQAELELIGQEETILGYMAKLVALDATALSEEVSDAELIDSDTPEGESLTGAVKFFVGQ
ncbi:MAG: hypothetical protein QF666_11865 [Alphaproteobacteria bacterium]|nr:hypothetical protein [Alphaproteobacteria bacterium]